MQDTALIPAQQVAVRRQQIVPGSRVDTNRQWGVSMKISAALIQL
jgi:hypothetical protein